MVVVFIVFDELGDFRLKFWIVGVIYSELMEDGMLSIMDICGELFVRVFVGIFGWNVVYVVCIRCYE